MGSITVKGLGRWAVPSTFLLLLVAYHLIFGQFFPTRNGTLGDDYSYVLPGLLDGYYWFRSNGLFEPFWFTPSFCGGQPVLGDPQSGYYSVAQFLTFAMQPLSSVYATVLVFASIGFWGFFVLLRSCFASSRQAALLGGALFMFNGFFIHRMLIGHFAFHGVMLVPWIACFLLRPSGKGWLPVLFNGAVAGCLLAYGTYSGMAHLLLPCALAVLGIASMHALAGRQTAAFISRGLCAVLVSAALSAAKLTAVLLYISNFPRSDYTLPGLTSMPGALHLLLNALFISPADIAEQARPLVAGMQWPQDRHEWEYGVTVVPLLIVVTGAAILLLRNWRSRPRLDSAAWGWIGLLGLVIALPLALNLYTPDWNAFLKQLPVIKSSSTLFRWFLVYIPVVILLAALMLDRVLRQGTARSALLLVALLALLSINALKDRDYYQSQTYRPDAMDDAWQAVHAGTLQPQIEYVGSLGDAGNRVQLLQNRNDLIARGISQFACYNPIFGYRMEYFPAKTLHLGPVMAETNGLLNLKDPACYTYPEQNNCTPGDHFTVAQREAAQSFAGYKPFPFEFSPVQKFANMLTLGTLALLAVLFSVTLIAYLRRP